MMLEDEMFLKALIACDGHIVPRHNNRVYPVFAGANQRRRPVRWVEKQVADRLLQQKCLEPKRQFLKVSNTTRAALLARHKSAETSQQHIVEKQTFTPEGVKRPIRHNLNRTVLQRLSRKITRDGSPYFSVAEIEAGEQFARDYALGGLGLVRGVNYGAAQVDGTRDVDRVETAQIRQMDRRKRVNDAISCLGALDKIIIAICCDNRPLEDVERTEQWARHTGLTVLKLALGQLVKFYGTEPGIQSPYR